MERDGPMHILVVLMMVVAAAALGVRQAQVLKDDLARRLAES